MDWKTLVIDVAIVSIKKFFSHITLADLRGLILSLVDDRMSGAEKRKRVEAVFFASTEGWRLYAARALIELVLAQLTLQASKSVDILPSLKDGASRGES